MIKLWALATTVKYELRRIGAFWTEGFADNGTSIIKSC